MSTSFPLETMRVRFAGETDVGRKRAHNEDSLYLPDEERLVIVADGMGGHACGDVASRVAIETMVAYFAATSDEPEVTWPFLADAGARRHETRLVTAIKLANLKLHEMSQGDPDLRGMGTTVVAGYFCDDCLLIGHVGDSRIYRVRGGVIDQLTEDHSLLNDYIRMKRIDPADVDAFPHKNVIVRALGMKETVAVDTRRLDLRLGDVYVFCSDGLSGMLDDETIYRIVLADKDLDHCCELLVEAANAAGGTDNITVALARLEPG